METNISPVIWVNNASEKLKKVDLPFSTITLIIDKYFNMKIDEFMLLEKINNKEIDLVLEEVLKKEKPVAYIIGYEIFYGYKIFVTNDVLIPRVETEELVSKIIDDIKTSYSHGTAIEIVDLCTGSGVIGLVLMAELSAFYKIKMTITDVSKKALIVAKKNFTQYNLKCNILAGDLLKPLGNKKFDVLVSNPPYISNGDYVPAIVKKNEPNIALYGGNLGFELYESILKDVNKNIKKNGFVYFEIGDTQGRILTKLVEKYLNKKTYVYNDLFGRQRIVKIKF